jgi:hypothetical protein
LTLLIRKGNREACGPQGQLGQLSAKALDGVSVGCYSHEHLAASRSPDSWTSSLTCLRLHSLWIPTEVEPSLGLWWKRREKKEKVMTKRHLNKEEWVDLFRTIGLDDAAMDQWHREFEQRAPEAHQSFLEWLKISAAEIDEIRDHYRK